MNKNKMYFIVTLSFLLVVFNLKAQNPGDLYEDFGTDGISTFDYLGIEQIAYDMVIKDNDKIIAAGLHGSQALVVRFKANGAIDPSFGFNGMVLIDLGGNEYITAVALKPDGKIVFAGNASSTVFIGQLLNDGSFDTGFDVDGILEIYSYKMEEIEDIEVLPNGKILVAGFNVVDSEGQATIARIRPDGYIDVTFGENGFAYVGVDDAGLVYYALTIAEDEKIISTGYSVDYDDVTKCILTKHNSDGTIDDSFGDNGLLTFGGSEHPMWGTSVIVDNNNKIVIGGIIDFGWPEDGDLFLQRLFLDGSYDYDFGSSGIQSYNTGGPEEVLFSLSQQDDDKYVFTGFTGNKILVFRTLNSGNPDPDFGIDGYVLLDINGGENVGYSIGFHSDLNIIVAGYNNPPGVPSSDLIVVKYYSGLFVGQSESSKVISDINIYPNPAYDNLNIVFQDMKPINAKIRIFDVNGVLVFEERGMVIHDVYQLENLKLKSGVYFIKAQTEKREFVRKLIIKK